MANDTDTFTLYGHVRSGNVYKPALMMALTQTPFHFHQVDLPNGEQRGDEYLAMNPFGKVPALAHGSLIIRQSNTALLYLASHTGQFGARDQEHRLRVSEWLFWEQDQMFPGVGRTRFFTKVVEGDPAVVAHFRGVGEAALGRLEEQLGESAYLAGDSATIADVSIYAYARLAEDAGFDMAERPRVVAWRESMEALPGYQEPAALLG
jgi:glutathione S-transferase